MENTKVTAVADLFIRLAVDDKLMTHVARITDFNLGLQSTIYPGTYKVNLQGSIIYSNVQGADIIYDAYSAGMPIIARLNVPGIKTIESACRINELEWKDTQKDPDATCWGVYHINLMIASQLDFSGLNG